MRVKPGFEPDSYQAQHPEDESPSCFLMLLIMVIGYFIFSAISRTTLSGFAGTSDQFICYGTLLGVAILYIQAKRQEKQDKQKLHEARQEWRRTCKSDEAAIVSREASSGGTYEDGYYPGEWHHHSPSYRLGLKMNADQGAVKPNQTIVGVKVSKAVYDCLENRDTVRIYYRPEEPFTYLLEEEL